MALINRENPKPTAGNFEKQSFFAQNKWPIIIISLSAVIIFVIVWFAFLRSKPAGNAAPKVSLSIDAASQIPSGSEIVYKVHVSNNDGVLIKNVLLDLVYPAGFSFAESTPQPGKLNGTQFNLPEIGPNQDLVVMIKGHIQGNASENKTISGLLHYTPANFNSDFIARGSASTEIVTANVSLDFVGAASANTDQQLTYILNYANFVTNPIANFKISLTVPQTFKVDKYEPAPTLGTTWNLGTLQSSQSGTIKITGTFVGSTIGDQQTFTAKSEGDAGTGSTLVLSANQYLVTIVPIALEPILVLFGGQQQNTPDIVDPGASLSYKVTYKNNSQTPAHGVILSVSLDGSAFDLSSVQAEKAAVNNNLISWDAAQNPQFESLEPNAKGDFTFSVRVKNPATKNNQKNLELKAQAQMRSNDYEQAFQSKIVDLKIASVPEIDSVVTSVSGARPPRVGQATTYNIVLSLRNTTNDLAESVLTMNLPNASFGGVSSTSPESGNVTYDQAIKKVVWNAGKLLANTGTFNPIRKLEFTVTINPGAASANQIATLVNNISFKATDSFTGQKASAAHRDLTSGDDTKGQGTVQP